jgi:hypothetical protein
MSFSQEELMDAIIDETRNKDNTDDFNSLSPERHSSKKETKQALKSLQVVYEDQAEEEDLLVIL